MGARVGTIFVELDLDTKRWSAAQKRILNDARMTGLDVEKNFKNLGVKSEALWDMMKGQAINALVGIKHSATSTTNDIIVAEKAAAIKHKAIQDGKINQMKKVEAQYAALFDEAIAKENAANAESQLAKIKYDKEYTSFWSTELKKRETVEETSRAKQNAANAESQLAKIRYDKEYTAFWETELNKREMANVEDQLARIKYDKEYTSFWATELKKRDAAEEASIAKQNTVNAEEQLARMKYDKEYTAFWETELKKRDVAEKAIRQAAHAEYLAMENARTEAQRMNAQKRQQAEQARWNTLGIRSEKAIKEEMAAVMASHRQITNSKHASTNDIINADRAKNAKLKTLNAEMVGNHQMSMAAMTRAVLRFYAAYFVISQVGRVVVDTFMDGVKAIDDMKISAVSVAAQITSMQGSAGDVTENYKKNLEYAEALVPVLMKIDATSFANLTQIQRINMAMTNQGVLLDTNNAKQVRSFTALTNAIALFTVGQNKEKQATQETRALMTGQIKMTDMVAMQLDSLIKKEGKYIGGLKEVVKLGREHRDTLERLEPYLIGVIAASGDIGKTWEAVSSSMDTAFTILQKELFTGFYEDLINSGLDLVDSVKNNTKKIADFIKDSYNAVAFAIKSTIALLATFSVASYVAMRKAATDLAWYSKAWTALGTNVTLQTSKMALGLSTFVAASAGYSFGTWLNGFKEVKIASIFWIDLMMKGFYELEAAMAKMSMGFGEKWKMAIIKMEAALGEFLWKAGQGLEKLPFMKSAGAAVKAYAQTLASADEASAGHSAEYLKKEKEIEDQLKKNLAIVDATTASELARVNAGKGLDGKPLDQPIIPGNGGGADDEDKTGKMIANLEWQISIINKTAEEQTALNMVRSAGTTIDTEAGKKIHDLTLELSGANTQWAAYRENLASMGTYIDDYNQKTEEMLDSLVTPIEKLEEEFNAIEERWANGSITSYEDYLKLLMKATEKYAPELVEPHEDAAEKVEAVWDQAARNIHDVWTNTLNDIFTGKTVDISGLTDSIGNALTSTVTNSMSADFATAQKKAGSTFMGSVGAGLGAIDPVMLGLGVGLSALSSVLGKQNQPSYGEELKNAIAPLTREMIANTEAIKINTQELLRGADYSGAGIIGESIIPKLTADIFKNRSIVENIALPPLLGEHIMGQISNIMNAGGSVRWGNAKADPKELSAMFTMLFKGFEDDIGGLGFILEALSNGAIAPFIRAIDDLDNSFELTNEQVLALNKDFADGSLFQRNKEIVGENIKAVMDEIFATITNEATSLGLGFKSSFEGIAEGFDFNLNISVFETATTAYGKSFKDFNATIGDETKGLTKQVNDLRTLYEGGFLPDLDPQIIELLYNFNEAVGVIVENIEKYYQNLRGETLNSMSQDIAIANGSLSMMAQNYLSLKSKADDYTESLINNGMATNKATAAGEEYLTTMNKEAWAKQTASDRQSYEIKQLQLLGDSAGLLAIQRDNERLAIDTLYGATSDTAKEMHKLAEETYLMEDAVNDLAGAMASLSSNASMKLDFLGRVEKTDTEDYFKAFLQSQGLQIKGNEDLLKFISQDIQTNNDLREVMLDLSAMVTKGTITQSQGTAFYSLFTSVLDRNTQATIDNTAAIEDERQNNLTARQVIKDASAWQTSYKNPLTEFGAAFAEAMSKVEDEAADLVSRLRATGKTPAESFLPGGSVILELQNIAAKNFGKDFLDSINDSIFDLTATDVEKENKRYAEALAYIDEMLTAIPTLLEDFPEIYAKEDEYHNLILDNLSEQIDKANDYASAIKSLDDYIWNLQGGSLSGVQSIGGMQKRYDELYKEAMDSGDASQFISFASGEYSQFMQSLGTGWDDIRKAMIQDAEALKAPLTEMQAMFDLTSATDVNTTATEALTTAMTSVATVMAGFNESYYRQNNPDVLAAINIGDFISGLQHYLEYGKDEGRAGSLPGFASGGSFIAGENGAEIININRGSSAGITNNADTTRIISEAVAKAVAGIGGGETTINLKLEMDGKDIKVKVLDTITSKEGKYRIKAVVNG